MCGACGLLTGSEHWDGLMTSDDQIRRIRLLRLAHLKKMLRAAHVSIDDVHGQHFQLTGPTGKSALVVDIGAIWPAVAAVGGKPIDPLDTVYIRQVRGLD